MQTHIEQFNHYISIRLYKRTLFFIFSCSLLLLTHGAYSQTYNVRGKVTTSTTPVQYALVTFIDQSDTLKKFTTLTDTSGNYQLSIITSVEEKPNIQPTKIELEQNYPNPFSTSTAISYSTKKPADVKITIYDILGREVKKFSIGYKDIGRHGIVWDGRNEVGDKVATGIYFYRLQTENETLIKKMVFMGNMRGVNIPVSSNMLPQIVTRKNHTFALTQMTSNKYTIRISNTENTEPQIELATEENIIITQDTVINIRVLDATPGLWHYLGLGGETVQAIAVHPTDSNVIYVGTGSDFSSGGLAKLFKTTNGGRNWDTLLVAPPPYSFYYIVIDPLQPETLYTTPLPVLKSTNGGKTWVEIINGMRVDLETRAAPILIDPNNTNTLYCGTTGFFGGSFYKSTDGGENWSNISRDSLNDGVISIAIDLNNSNTIYTGTAFRGILWKTTDAGETWFRTGLGETNQLINAIDVDPFNSDNIYASVSFEGLYVSDDGGMNWLKEFVNDSIGDIMSIVLLRSMPHHLYVAGVGCFVRKCYDGHWIEFNNGLTNKFIMTMKSDVQERNLFIGVNTYYIRTGGIYVRRIPR